MSQNRVLIVAVCCFFACILVLVLLMKESPPDQPTPTDTEQTSEKKNKDRKAYEDSLKKINASAKSASDPVSTDTPQPDIQTTPKPRTFPISAYETYITSSHDFTRVKQDKDWAYKAWPSWLYIPWFYQWTIGFDDASGEFSKAHGYNGALMGRHSLDRLPWIEKHNLRFYVGHLAGKGDLFLRKKDFTEENKKKDIPGTGYRFVLLDEKTMEHMKGIMKPAIEKIKASGLRSAYALDDEISWGSFLKPCMWRIVKDPSLYQNWLNEIYGSKNSPKYKDWISYNDIRKELREWSLKDFNCGQLMDQWTFNDAHWANTLGELVEFSNSIDPATPCGVVGAQAPNAFGGFDYARLMRKLQFIEPYNNGGSQAIVRSFNPHNALPQVTTHFHKKVKDTVWQTWYYLAHGNRGLIGWVEEWFDGKTPKDFHKKVGPHYLEAGKTIGPLQAQSEWLHDGVAIYYSHPSIQMSWIMDAESHGSTWPNRNGDSRLGTSHMVRKAWENMLRDEGIQFTYINYVDAIRNGGIPDVYKVLILPATFCMSDIEAYHIQRFCENGGTVIADFLPGVFDQHGMGRKEGGALDDMFGVKHDMNIKASGVFMSRLWAETDQDKNFSWKTYDELLSNGSDAVKDASGFNVAVKSMGTDHVQPIGNGTAVMMNLSPQWYNAYRVSGMKASHKRETFIKHVKNAGIGPWVRIENAGENTFSYEITYWRKGNRTILFLISNPEIKGTSLGGGNSVGLKSEQVDVQLVFTFPVSGIVNERTGKAIPDGKKIKVTWIMNEAVVLSFNEHPHPAIHPVAPIK